MKKLFISQPMKGKTDEEILREREQAVREAEKYLKENGMQEEVQLIDSGIAFDSRPCIFCKGLGESQRVQD